jgi:hypothetical protein
MAGSASNANSPGEPIRPTTERPAGPLPPPTDPALLEKVLERTRSAAESTDAADSADIQRLRSIAHRRKGQPLVVEPVVVEMVRAVLGAEFAGLDKDPERFRDMTLQIARTLMDDPAACKRLESMWRKLNET